MNILIIASQQFPGTTDTGLYLICNEQDIMLFAEVVAPAEITVIGNNYACLSLYRLQQETDYIGLLPCFFQCFYIIILYFNKTRRVWS